MIPFFTKPVQRIDAADLDALWQQSFPESYNLEFKEALPKKDGGQNAWLNGSSKIGDYARDEILDEVIAFANSQGGYVVLGMTETQAKPPRAQAIALLPRVGELARKLEDQARTCIDIPLPRLVVHPVEFNANGDGCVVLYTGPSGQAPHRLSTTGQFSMRRGTSTVKMNAREIQDMTLNSARGLAAIDTKFDERRAAFFEWGARRELAACLRITCVPLEPFPDPGRLLGQAGLWASARAYKIDLGPQQVTVDFGVYPTIEKPIVRGRETYGVAGPSEIRIEQFQSGVVDLWLRAGAAQSGAQMSLTFQHDWTLFGLANALNIVDVFRTATGAPNTEYALEVELAAIPTVAPILYYGIFGYYGSGGVHPISKPPLRLPRWPVMERAEFDRIVNGLDTDIYDAFGSTLAPKSMKVVW